MARHLTVEERDRIAQLKNQGANQKEIARALQRSPSTISRELQRNGSENEYFAAQAQHRAASRRRERPLRRKMDDLMIAILTEAKRRGIKFDSGGMPLPSKQALSGGVDQ